MYKTHNATLNNKTFKKKQYKKNFMNEIASYKHIRVFFFEIFILCDRRRLRIHLITINIRYLNFQSKLFFLNEHFFFIVTLITSKISLLSMIILIFANLSRSRNIRQLFIHFHLH